MIETVRKIATGTNDLHIGIYNSLPRHSVSWSRRMFVCSLDGWLSAIAVALISILVFAPSVRGAQDIVRTGTDLGQQKTRIAVSNFRAAPDSAELARLFDEVLWNDLDYSGICEMVSKSMYPLTLPSVPAEVNTADWMKPPASAKMLAFGNAAASGNQFVVQGWLVDTGSATQPVVLGKQYWEDATKEGARLAAHKFADEIIFQLGGGVAGIAQSKIVFIRRMSPQVKEVWIMDHDGANQRQITHLNSIALTPALSLDGSQVAFTSYAKGNPDIAIFSLLTGKQLPFFNRAGLNTTPTWSPDGKQLAFTSSVTTDPEIYLGDSRGQTAKRLTFARGVDISPAWNPKTGNQIAFVSDRPGKPQIFIMDADGTNVTQVVNGGNQALDPAWSPNGRLLAFTWDAGGEYDIHLMDVATKQIVQMTINLRRNEHPSWSPNGRHIVFQSNRTGKAQIWSMLADGSRARQLTFDGENSEPVWSMK